MTAQEADNQIMDDYEKFRNHIYQGKIPVPENIITLFKAAVLAVGYKQHKISALRLRAVGKKKSSELTNGDINDVISIIQEAPLGKVHAFKLKPDEKFDDAIERHIMFEKFIVVYNAHIGEFQKGLEMKRTLLVPPAAGGRGLTPVRN